VALLASAVGVFLKLLRSPFVVTVAGFLCGGSALSLLSLSAPHEDCWTVGAAPFEDSVVRLPLRTIELVWSGSLCGLL